jgi:hypothetical protein
MKKYLPFFSGLLLTAIIVGGLEYVVMKKSGGHFCYPLDDTFIHLAVAKNMALHHTWGINATDWVSCSSSPLFTGLLVILFKIFSVNLFIPLLVAAAGTVLILLAMQKELDKYSRLSITNKTICVAAVLILGAVPALTLLGMEHTLQIAFTLFFAQQIASYLVQKQSNNLWQAAGFAALMCLTRYENASLVIAAFILLAWQKQYKAAFIIAASGSLPLILFGLYSKMHGGFFVPNSIMIKANQNLIYLLNGGSSIIENSKSISGILILAIIIVLNKVRENKMDRDFWMLSMLIVAGLMHAAFASFGWFYRYEAYLIVLGMLQLGKMGLTYWQENGWTGIKKNIVWVGLSALLLFNLPLRGINSMRNSIRAIYNIYEQQYQMGLFMKQYYQQQTVAANDIGAISYYGNINTLDLWGLGNNDVAIARKKGYWNNDFIRKLVNDKQTKIAVIYDSWFDKDLPNQWFKVATWEMPYNYICGDIKVSFYGISEKEASILKTNLAAFAPELPKDVKVAYFR